MRVDDDISDTRADAVFGTLLAYWRHYRHCRFFMARFRFFDRLAAFHTPSLLLAAEVIHDFLKLLS